MDLFFAACDLVVCRAGAMTVSEVAATRTPAVLVPLESVGQQFNAAALGDAAVMVRQDDAATLPGLVASLIGDPGRRAAMADASGPIGVPDPAGSVAASLLREAAR